MPPKAFLDPSLIDCSHVIADREAIRKFNPQRFEMEQLDAVVMIDPTQHLIVAYKDVRADEFWVPGHMPGFPLLPGVLMLEAAAQMASYYTSSENIVRGLLGFGGLEAVKFRAPVKPGDRLVLVGKGVKLDRRETTFDVQGFVGEKMVFEARVIGRPLREGKET